MIKELKVLVVSDKINRLLYSPEVKKIAGDVDLIISCGDLPAYYLDYLATMLNKPLLYVCGNHDPYDIKKKNSSINIAECRHFAFSTHNYNTGFNFGGINLDQKPLLVQGMLFFGLEGSYAYNDGAHQYTDHQMALKIFRLKPRLWLNRLLRGRYIDVLVTHAPPFGIHDKKDLPHRGFETFLKFMKKYRPRYLLHGHVHIPDLHENRISNYLDTTVINCYDYRILELNRDGGRK